MENKVYILGGAQTDFSRNWHREEKSIFDMFKEVMNQGLVSSGLEPAQIEVGHVGNFVGELFAGQGLMGGFFGQAYAELAAIPTSRHEAACASGSMAALAAMSDIQAGHYGLACVVGIELMRNVPGKVGADYLGAATYRGIEATNCDYPWPYMFDLLAQEYDKRYGMDYDSLKTIAQINYANARVNPYAQSKSWSFEEKSFTNDDELNPIIEGKLRKMDCGQITDGAACVFLASEKIAKQHAQKQGLSLRDIPYIKGWGHRSAPLLFEEKMRLSQNSPLIFPHARLMVQDALTRAGMSSVAELDGLETHDCFTITEYMAIDHWGLTEPGESYKAIEAGRISKDGDFPINPSGGLIGLGHPVGATGVRMMLDCYQQVTGQAGNCQLSNVNNMATFNLGGSATTCASFIIGR
ncbi:thiolase domain-containing protein [Thalassotalea euphylliae]|uniref:Thiolase domain-containing protein n=1 Tax=Thalassotalea euphylliae TaxID=1655234 RepID=A0A3E0TQY0_9GAMM|nr:acetyl-CoA acetyltransferase [Thalassotalea euphylliae]REL26355.1 thiolase domain-containing protein [Thalassotalea euphylliae]